MLIAGAGAPSSSLLLLIRSVICSSSTATNICQTSRFRTVLRRTTQMSSSTSFTTTSNSASTSPSKIPVDCQQPTSSPPIAMKTAAESHASIAANGVEASSPTTTTILGQPSNNGSSHQLEDELWVFGYGSLVWKVDFPVAESQRGYIRGFRRRFFQQSIDHRGTPDKPGLVVTLIPDEADPAILSPPPFTASTASVSASPPSESRVFGVAHRIANDQRSAVIEHLDHREKNGYVRHTVDFYAWPTQSDGQPAGRRPICLYLASADNESYAGPLQMERIASQVFEAHGPSGPNVDYVFRLAEAMRELFPGERDEHLFELERTLRRMERDQQRGKEVEAEVGRNAMTQQQQVSK